MKKLNKFFAVLVALAMMATLAVTMAFAAPDTDQVVTDVNLKKTLTKNDGTTTPTANFVFKIAPNTEKGNSGAPAIDDQVFEYNSTAQLVQSKDLDNLIEAAMTAKNTPNGQYAYDVYESVADSTQSAADGSETYTYDTQTKYRVRVYKSADGYTYTVSKVDPTTGEETKQPIGSQEGTTKTTDLPFENKYVKSKIVDPDGGDPEDPTNPSKDAEGFFVQKNVDNDTAGLYNDKEFTFTLTAVAPAVNTLSENKTGYSYEVVEVGGNGTALRTGKVVPNESPAKTEVLKTNQRIVFTDLDVGAKITVKEADYTADFTPTAKLDGVSVNTILTGTEATIDEAGTALKVLNTSKNKTTPEGILISNLPYIALALVAIGGLVAYVVVRRRNADEA